MIASPNNSTHTGKVLLTGAEGRGALPVIRSLGRRGISVTVGAETGFAYGRFSKYTSQFVRCPSASESPAAFVSFLLDRLARDRHELVISDEQTLMLIAREKERFSQYVHVPIPDYEIFRRAHSKLESTRLAQQLGIPCPITHFISDLAQVDSLKDKIDYPLVIKPQDSYGSRGIVSVRSPQELMPKYRSVHNRYPFPLIQDRIPPGGRKFQVCALFNRDSQPRAAIVHQLYRDFPVDGGPGTLFESIHYPELMEVGLRLLRALGWYGVAAVEFLEDPRDGEIRLLEINPRFWGTLQVSISAGIDFPYLLYKMVTEGDVERCFEYEAGRRGRWLLPGDILHFIKNPNRFHLEPSFFDFFDRSTDYVVLSRDDPVPTLAFVLASFRDLLDKDKRRQLAQRM